MFAADPTRLRQQLLEVNGIGPETADSILLYAGEKPFFVVDAYTRRIFSRQGLIADNADYHAMQGFFMDNLPVTPVFSMNIMHLSYESEKSTAKK